MKDITANLPGVEDPQAVKSEEAWKKQLLDYTVKREPKKGVGVLRRNFSNMPACPIYVDGLNRKNIPRECGDCPGFKPLCETYTFFQV